MQPTDPPLYDLVIIGAGPAGLAAAIYSAREDISTLVVEKAVVGGMAALTEVIDNYPGFENGIGGLELSDKLYAQAKRFGAQVKTGIDVQKIARVGDIVELTTKKAPLQARTVLITTGSTYRQLGVPGETEMIGRGVHFCATCDGPVYRGRDLIVVGGGNSAMQEIMFLTKFASHITMLVRGPELKGSAILREQVSLLENLTIVYNTVIDKINVSDDKVTGVSATTNNEGVTYEAPGIFVLIGLLANTGAFKDSLTLDDRDFIVTDAHFLTSIPGVYAAGDVRSGSTWQIASAVGEGVSATLEIRTYLDNLAHAERHAKRAATA
ncbi:FAD-dependent oxidoreductase [Candidatus Saccharibacteria bacterium]|nr:FAD-dependent oxidoreductase [Candidatus Saccharibacteria bacterium]